MLQNTICSRCGLEMEVDDDEPVELSAWFHSDGRCPTQFLDFNFKPVKQELPDECVRASVASIFGLSKLETPHFYKLAGKKNTSWFQELREWLIRNGWDCDILDRSLPFPENEYYLGIGESTNVGHCVVMKEGKIVHDPSGYGIKKWDGWVKLIKKD